jgi:hypothetical protein
MAAIPGVPDAAITAAALVLADVEGDDQTCRGVAEDVLRAAQPHLAYAAGRAAGDRIAALEQLAAGMLASFSRTDAGYRARVGQVQIRRWQAVLSGDGQ